MAQTVDQKLLKRTKFPPEFSQKVDMEKVNVEVMKKSVHIHSPPIASLTITILFVGGLPARSLRFLALKMML